MMLPLAERANVPQLFPDNDYEGIHWGINQPGVGGPLLALADTLLFLPHPTSNLSNQQRERIAGAVSGENWCQYCHQSHEAHAEKADTAHGIPEAAVQALIVFAREISHHANDFEKQRAQAAAAMELGTSEADVGLTIQIAAFFAMCNILVDGSIAPTPSNAAAFLPGAMRIARQGYQGPNKS